MQYGTYMTWAGLVCILAYMLGQWRDVVDFYGTRQARYGTMSIVGVLVAVGIFAAVNYLGVRQTKRWDLTENQVYSLSEQSVKILQGLEAPVQWASGEVQQWRVVLRGDQELALRPEGTAPVCRAYLEHGMQNQPQPVRLWYWMPNFRYDRPQAGRHLDRDAEDREERGCAAHAADRGGAAAAREAPAAALGSLDQSTKTRSP